MSVTNPWAKHQSVVEAYLEYSGYDNALREPTIKGTMFVGDCSTTRVEYNELVKHEDYDNCWRKAIQDDGTFNPERFPLNPNTSGNYIHCAYHLMRLKIAHDIKVRDVSTIVEVGAGYGSMAKVCRQAGFKGTYYLFDLPIFSKLQSVYLANNSKYEFITDLDKLSDLSISSKDNTLFISTWAASEMPEEYRDRVLNQVNKFKYVLLAYQSMFEGMDIYTYFEEWQQKTNQYVWLNEYCVDKNHRYLFGRNFYD